jgi:hypothetical protein
MATYLSRTANLDTESAGFMKRKRETARQAPAGKPTFDEGQIQIHSYV